MTRTEYEQLISDSTQRIKRDSPELSDEEAAFFARAGINQLVSVERSGESMDKAFERFFQYVSQEI